MRPAKRGEGAQSEDKTDRTREVGKSKGEASLCELVKKSIGTSRPRCPIEEEKKLHDKTTQGKERKMSPFGWLTNAEEK